MNQQEDPEEVRRLLDARGYKCVFKPRSLPNILRYRAPVNGQDVEGYVTPVKKAKQQAYDVAFGATCKAAERPCDIDDGLQTGKL
jgi:hypothetical protein